MLHKYVIEKAHGRKYKNPLQFTNEDIDIFLVQIEKFTKTQNNKFYKNFDCGFIKDYIELSFFEKKFYSGSRIEFYENIIFIIQGEFDYGTLYGSIICNCEEDGMEFLYNNFKGTLGGDSLNLVIVPKKTKVINNYKIIISYKHHAFLHDENIENMIANSKSYDSKACTNEMHINFNFDDQILGKFDKKNLFLSYDFDNVPGCHSVYHIHMKKIYINDDNYIDNSNDINITNNDQIFL
jgi:hypothetical protein